MRIKTQTIIFRKVDFFRKKNIFFVLAVSRNSILKKFSLFNPKRLYGPQTEDHITGHGKPYISAFGVFRDMTKTKNMFFFRKKSTFLKMIGSVLNHISKQVRVPKTF